VTGGRLKAATDSFADGNGYQRRVPAHCIEQIFTIAEALERALVHGDLTGFYQAFRSTDLPFIGTHFQHDAYGLFVVCFEVLHRLGGISPATALAVENHYYVSSAIATFPAVDNPELNNSRQALLALIVNDRLLVANTNSKIHSDKLGDMGTSARLEEDGFRITGRAAYTSLATQGDLLVFLTQIEGEGPALFSITPMQGDPRVEIGPYLFPSAMLDSDTRQIIFHELLVPKDRLIAGGKDAHVGLLINFEMAWHQVLIPALYLGAAARAIEEARKFLRATHGKDGRPLAELDGMMIDVGRMALDYQSACSLVHQAGQALGAVKQLPKDARLLERAVDLASAAKYTGTRCAESIVTTARRIIGARVFVGGHPLERLSQEVMFASLGPEVSAVIERRYGSRVLDDHSFLDWALDGR
jgi:alkylation response protein AidB-like acyl-CoA dehydrogenase